MAKQKLKSSLKAAPRATVIATTEAAIADPVAPIKAGRKRKVRPRRDDAKGAVDGKASLAAKRKAGKARRAKLAVKPNEESRAGEAAHPRLVGPKRGVKPQRPQTRPPPLDRLALAIDEVRLNGRSSPRTQRLSLSGVPKMAQKVIEEAGEVAIEAIQGHREAVVLETVDLFYNVLVLLAGVGVPLADVWAEMERREVMLGMAEKLPKLAGAGD